MGHWRVCIASAMAVKVELWNINAVGAIDHRQCLLSACGSVGRCVLAVAS